MDARTIAIFPFSTGSSILRQICSKKIKIVSLSWNSVSGLIRICKIQWRCSLFLFYTGNTLFNLDWKYHFWANLVQKIKIVSLSWNLVHSLTNSNMQNSMALFTFSALDRKQFLSKFGPKNQNCQFKQKFGF